MANEQAGNARVNRLSDDELRELLAADGYLRACPACGERQWTLINDTAELSPFLPAQSAEEPPKPQRIDCAILLCRHCGFMRIHERQLFYRFLEERRAALNTRLERAAARRANPSEE